MDFEKEMKLMRARGDVARMEDLLTKLWFVGVVLVGVVLVGWILLACRVADHG